LLQTVRELVINLPWGTTILFCLTMGLAHLSLYLSFGKS